MEDKDSFRAEESSAQSMPTPTNAGLPCRPEGVAEPHTLDTMSQHSAAVALPGRGRGRGGGGGGGGGGARSNFRGAYNQGRGGYDNTSSSSYGYLQPRQQYANRQSSWDSAQGEQHQQYVPQQQQRAGRGRGGCGYGQQNAVRRPYRASGRYRGSYSRPRRFHYDQVPEDSQDMTGMRQAPEQFAGYAGEGADIEATTTLPPHEIEESTGQHHDKVHTPVHFPNEPIASVESVVASAAATPVLEPHTPERNDAMSSHVRPDQTPSLVSDTTTTEATPSSTEQHDTSVTTNNPDSSSPTRPVNWQDLPFHNIASLVHPSHAPEMVYAWYPYAVMPGDGAHTSPPPPPVPLQSPLNMSSAGAPPPRPLLQQAPPPHLPPPHFYFTHDHAFLALCHPLPFMPCPMLPIPYLRYWGPERVGANPNFYDVPMFAADV